MPGLKRERFIADTLYKNYGNMTICHVHIGRGFLCFYLCFNRLIGVASLEKCWETFYKEVFMSGRSHEEGLKDLTY